MLLLTTCLYKGAYCNKIAIRFVYAISALVRQRQSIDTGTIQMTLYLLQTLTAEQACAGYDCLSPKQAMGWL